MTGVAGRGTGGDMDGGSACPEFEQLYYHSPGCNGTVAPVCSGPPPPCVTEACGCSGRTITGCGVYGEPWAYAGRCPTGDGGTLTLCTTVVGGLPTEAGPPPQPSCDPYSGPCSGTFNCGCLGSSGCTCLQTSANRIDLQCFAP
jgi:hypothetical protein